MGAGFFTRSGFYPGFILWVKGRDGGGTRVVLVEPHGLYPEGVFKRNRDKIEAFKALQTLSAKPCFPARGVSVDGYLLTHTPLDLIPGAESWEQLETEYRVIRQRGDYIRRLLEGVGG